MKKFITKKNAVDNSAKDLEKDPDLEEVSLYPAKKKSKKKLILLILAGILVIGGGTLVGASVINSKKPMKVSVKEATIGEIDESINSSGFVKSSQVKTYFAPVDAIVKEAPFLVGDVVNAGDLLASFDTAELETAAQRADLTVTSSTAEYRHSISESAKKKAEYDLAAQNVELYKLLICAQRAYINDLNYAVDNKTYDVSQSAQCLRDSYQKKINAKAEEAANVKKEMNDFSITETSSEKDIKKFNELSDRLIDLETEQSKLSGAMSSVSSIVNTAEEKRQIATAQDLLSDMQNYLSKDQAKMDSAKAAILDANQKEKLQADTAISELSAKEATNSLSAANEGIHADFTGIVTDAPALPGSKATKGNAIITVESVEDVYVDVTITKYNIDRIALNQKADITIAGNSFHGTVTKINRKAVKNDQGNPVITAQVHIDDPNENIFLGVEAKVIIDVAHSDDAVLVPVETLNTDMNGSFCYVVENGKIMRRTVVSGIRSDTMIQVVSGIKAGDLILTDDIDVETVKAVEPVLEDELYPDEAGSEQSGSDETDTEDAGSDETDTDSSSESSYDTTGEITAGAAGITAN